MWKFELIGSRAEVAQEKERTQIVSFCKKYLNLLNLNLIQVRTY